MGCECVNGLQLAQNRDQLPDLANTVMNPRLKEIVVKLCDCQLL